MRQPRHVVAKVRVAMALQIVIRGRERLAITARLPATLPSTQQNAATRQAVRRPTSI
jgi:hypothetical protein